REKGMDRVLGPVNPSTNEECGLLVQNFLSPPLIMMTYNPPYYMDLIEKAGYGKEKDLYAYSYHMGKELPDRLKRILSKIQKREKGLVVRPLDLSRFDADLEVVKLIYNEAWEKNWGFVPMTDAEIDHMAKKLKPLVVPSIINFAFIDDEPAGFVMALPDYNQVLKILNGTIANPFRTIKAFRAGKRLRSGRCLTLGVREKFRQRGIETLLFAATWQGGIEMNYRYGEFSWVLEDNQPMNDAATRMFFAEHYKTYRVYVKQLTT
ncbi:N-acetyltransferase, partial [bacterium]|nr:N-acetyltransferase [bacterium]